MKVFTIGKIAKQAGLGVETIRFYERVGLLEEPPRTKAGYRQYPPETVDKLRFIQKSKRLGFSLQEIGELFSLRLNQNATCGDVKTKAEEKIRSIEKKIYDLTRMKEALTQLTLQCNGIGPVHECPILAALEPAGEDP
ncbi:MerR family transcriptional regulator [Desulfomarina sp.]